MKDHRFEGYNTGGMDRGRCEYPLSQGREKEEGWCGTRRQFRDMCAPARGRQIGIRRVLRARWLHTLIGAETDAPLCPHARHASRFD